MDHDPLRRGVAEFIGTFTLIFAGAGSIVTFYTLVQHAGITGADQSSAVPIYGLAGIAFAHGLAIAVMVSALGHISGAHFNPAVTFGFLITRRIAWTLALVYWVAQFAGATAAALLLNWIYPSAARTASHLGAPGLLQGIGPGQGLAVEMVLTFFLVIVVFASAVDSGGTFKAIAGLGIGFTVTLAVFMGGPLTGAALNPARAFGPQLVADFWTNGWIYYVGPVVGASLAALLYEYLYLRARPKPVGTPDTGVLEPRPGDAASS